VAEVRVPVGPGVEHVARVVGVHQVDPAGDRLDPVDEPGQLLAARVGVAGVEAEPDARHRRRLAAVAEDLPEPRDAVEPPGHRVAAARGVLHEERQGWLEPLERLGPVVEAGLRVVAGQHVTAVDHETLGADLGGERGVLREQLAARDADAVVRGGHVDDVRRVDVEVDARGLGVGPQPGGAPRVGHGRGLPALRVAEEELGQVSAAGPRLGERVGLVDVGTDA
jgi:hypothetical protein